MSIKIRKKPIEVEAIRWENNEPFIREFLNDDSLIHFSGNLLQVYNMEEKCWIDVPMFHFIIKGIKGEFYPISPEVLKRTYDIIEN